MTTILLLASLLPGPVYRKCDTAYSRQVYVAPAPYQQQIYASSYAQPYLEIKFAPVIHEAQYYTGLVGGEARARNKREQELQARADLVSSINGLSARIATLSVAPAIQPPPVAPGKPTPDVPGKPTPDVSPSLPPTPKVNPDNGDVPPPPPVPSIPPTGGIAAPDGNVMAILTRDCAKCHTAPAKAGKGVILFTEPGKLANLGPLDLVTIDQEVYSGSMPKNADPMSAEDYSKLRAWINGSQAEIEAALKACKTKAAQ